MDDSKQRETIAEVLIWFSLIGLVLISGLVLYWGSENKETPRFVFNSVLPLFGTWVGTVIAYYFSRSNFSTAASAYKRIAGPSEALEATLVTAAMIEMTKIVGLVTIPAGQTPANINLRDNFLNRLTPVVTRIPVVNSNGAIQFIVHESTLYKFVYRAARTEPQLAAATLQTLLDDEELNKLARTFAIVPASATLADAKAKMDETPNCEDVFVTQNGRLAEPVLGWITDVTIASHARV